MNNYKINTIHDLTSVSLRWECKNPQMLGIICCETLYKGNLNSQEFQVLDVESVTNNHHVAWCLATYCSRNCISE